MADPTAVAGLVGRWRYADLALANGTTIETITSSAGAAVAIAQGTAAKRPVYLTGVINGRAAADHDGVDDVLGATNTSYARNASGFTAYAIVRADSAAVGNRQIISISTPAATGTARFTLRTVDGKVGIGGRRLDADSFQVLAGSQGIVDGAAHVLCGVIDYANAMAYVYVDGTLRASGPFQTAGLTSDTVNAGFALGAQGNLTGEFFDGAMGEVLLYSTAHTNAADRAEVHTYAQDTYGVVSAGILVLTGQIASSGILAKMLAQNRAGEVVLAGAVILERVVFRLLSGAMATAGVLVNRVEQVREGTLLPAGTAGRWAFLAKAGSLQPRGVRERLPKLFMVGTVALTGARLTQSLGRVFGRAGTVVLRVYAKAGVRLRVRRPN